MKHLFLAVVISFVLARLALGQPVPLYENDGNVQAPPEIAPQIDAITFVNQGTFTVNLPPVPTLSGQIIEYFETANTLNYTNANIMNGSTGFRFETFTGGLGGNGFTNRAVNFVNTGSIIAGGANNSSVQANLFGLFGSAEIAIDANNVISPGDLEVGAAGLITVNGDNVDLTRGTLRVQGAIGNLGSGIFITTGTNIVQFANGAALNNGIFAQFWGVGTNTNVVGQLFLPDPVTPFEPVGTLNGPSFNQFDAPNATAYVNAFQNNPSNISYQVVFLSNPNPAVTTDVRFEPTGTDFSVPVIHWQGIATDALGDTFVNDLYLSDTFGADTNLTNLVGGFYGVAPYALSLTLEPVNYTFSTTFPFYNSLPTANLSSAGLGGFVQANYNLTNYFATYGVELLPTSTPPVANLPGSTLTNLPGRVEIRADNVLNLKHTRVDGANYLLVQSTNHYLGSDFAQIVVPSSDINLGSTNGSLTNPNGGLIISNLLAPVVPRLVGPVDAWSARWTNVNAMGLTNEFHVMIVSSDLQTTSPALVPHLALVSRDTNNRPADIVISDVLNVTVDMLLNANSLTLTTNAPGAATTNGQINLESDQIIWSASTTNLHDLTNYGIITIPNATYFAQAGASPLFNHTFTNAYDALVNHGFISVGSALFWDKYFENTGSGVITTNADLTTTTNLALITSTTGPITVQSTNAILTNGIISALASGISIASDTLVVSNETLVASGALTLSIASNLNLMPAYLIPNATNVNWTNFWSAGYGVNFLQVPTHGDLLATTITNLSPAGTEVPNSWAGQDFGPSNMGYHNNGAVGHLILDGADKNSAFRFTAPDPNNLADTNLYAIYVDLLELKNGATNRANVNGSEIFTALAVGNTVSNIVRTNMTIYYADAVAGTIDISEKLNGSLSNHVQWVPGYAGLFSSTNIVYPSGRTNTFNRALVRSQTIDSNGNGIPNAFDPTPIFTVDNLSLTLTLTNYPVTAAVIRWQSLAFSTNLLFRAPYLTSANWTNIAKITNGPAGGPITVIDPLQTNSSSFYRVEVDAAQP